MSQTDEIEEEVRVVLITAPAGEVAVGLARHLVGERLVACVNVVPAVTSVYRWEGEVQEEQEALLVAKTRASLVPELERRLDELHPYDVPECVTLAPERVEASYLAWLLQATGRER
jgi:periplasmic divalent cation tolerance protein